jgi:alkane 1-monooxygenase
MLLVAAYSVYGWGGAAFLLGQAAGSVVMLETVNYIEHYGLQRRQLPGGR